MCEWGDVELFGTEEVSRTNLVILMSLVLSCVQVGEVVAAVCGVLALVF